METSALIEQIEIESLYRHVMALEGVKHPLETPQALARAAAYLSSALHRFGLSVQLQPFKVEGFEDAFFNVEGWVGDETQPAIVLVGHYDNVWNDHGANDNAAGLAVILEIARILGMAEDEIPHIRFLFVSLEEGNPAFEIAKRESLRRSGLVDEQHRFTSHEIAQLMNRLPDFTLGALWSGETYRDGLTRFSEHFAEELTETFKTHLKDLEALYGDHNSLTSIGVLNRIGSTVWVREAILDGKEIAYAICLDEIGTVSHQPGSQRWPANLPRERLNAYRVDFDKRVGDFIFSITDEPSKPVGKLFFDTCQQPEIDLPCLWLPLAYGRQETAKQTPQALGSDHAPFWMAGIPALSLTDTAYLRNPYTHTPADTIDKVDFTQVYKVCQAVLSTILAGK